CPNPSFPFCVAVVATAPAQAAASLARWKPPCQVVATPAAGGTANPPLLVEWNDSKSNRVPNRYLLRSRVFLRELCEPCSAGEDNVRRRAATSTPSNTIIPLIRRLTREVDHRIAPITTTRSRKRHRHGTLYWFVSVGLLRPLHSILIDELRKRLRHCEMWTRERLVAVKAGGDHVLIGPDLTSGSTLVSLRFGDGAIVASLAFKTGPNNVSFAGCYSLIVRMLFTNCKRFQRGSAVVRERGFFLFGFAGEVASLSKAGELSLCGNMVNLQELRGMSKPVVERPMYAARAPWGVAITLSSSSEV
ncbi:hypothetical protein B296_00038320, partial [Ensete ventricosum]